MEIQGENTKEGSSDWSDEYFCIDPTELDLSGPLDEYVCIDPAESQLVLDYFRGLNKDARNIVHVHLQLCLHCKEKVAEFIVRKREIKAFGQIINSNGDGESVEAKDDEGSHRGKVVAVKARSKKAAF